MSAELMERKAEFTELQKTTWLHIGNGLSGRLLLFCVGFSSEFWWEIKFTDWRYWGPTDWRYWGPMSVILADVTEFE